MQFDLRYHHLDPLLFHRQSIASLEAVQAGHFNTALADRLQWSAEEKANWVEIINGTRLPAACDPLAMVYAGHQFGQWAGQLGDGRGLLIAQVRDREQRLIDLHLKGAGPTPYSRMGDGRAVLRSVIREYLAGHALQHLQVPSANALGFVYSKQQLIQRERLEPAAMLLRTADCHIRFGHFEWINHYQPQLLADFTAHCIDTYYPECRHSAEPVIAFAEAVVDKTAYMIAQWQLVGFAHGVMNSDNFNITGSTLDFGPFGFMERFRPQWINNHSDHNGRYSYQQQPSIGHWNLWILLNNLGPLGKGRAEFNQQLQQALAQYEALFLKYYRQGLCKKMGLPVEHPDSFDCGLAFLNILQAEKLDYSMSFYHLGQQEHQILRDDCLDLRAFDAFFKRYQQIRDCADQADLKQQMLAHNPRYILRNHMAQYAIERAEADDLSEVARLFQLLCQPYQRQDALEKPSDLAPLAADQADVVVSCSS